MTAYAPFDRAWSRFVHRAVATDNKYTRGVVGFVTGSEAYPGAAVIGVTAAMRFGIGMARFAAADEVAQILLTARPEAVRVSVDGELPRCDAWVVGSGVAGGIADSAEADWIRLVLDSTVPVVVDAGALQLAAMSSLSGRRILTPHAGEAVSLLSRLSINATRAEVEADAVGAAQQLANLTGAMVILKGNRSVVAAPGDVFWHAPSAPAELATAGTGDALAGLFGALIAANPSEDLFELAKFGIWLHAQAAFELAQTGPIAALDLAEHLRFVVAKLAGGEYSNE